MSDSAVLATYERLWPEARTIRTASFRCGGPRHPRRAADYLGFDLLNGGLREVWALSEALHLTDSSNVLDLGCGLGGPARFIAERYRCRVTGIDLTPRQLSIAQSLTQGLDIEPQIQFIRCDARTLPFADKTFTHVFSNEALIHVSRKHLAIQEAFRVMRQGGVFCVQDPVHDPRFQIPMLEDSLHPFSLDEYKSTLHQSGFCDVSVNDRTHQSEAAYALLWWLVEEGPTSPWQISKAIDHLHPGVLPPLWRFLNPTRLRHVLRYVRNRSRATLDLLEDHDRVVGVRRMCARIVSGYRTGAIRFYLISARKPDV